MKTEEVKYDYYKFRRDNFDGRFFYGFLCDLGACIIDGNNIWFKQERETPYRRRYGRKDSYEDTLVFAFTDSGISFVRTLSGNYDREIVEIACYLMGRLTKEYQKYAI